jgi:curved DNA-binding protein CbpA
METKDRYKVLGLSRDASQDDIRKAHRKLVMKYHPDSNPENPRAEERFKEVQQAYEVLSNEKTRREYDEGLRTSSRGSSGRSRSRESSSRPRARAGGRTAGGTTHTVDLSELLGKLTNLSSDGAGGRKGGSYELRGEEVAHLAKFLGEKISGLSELLGKDPARLSKLLGAHIRMNAKASFGDARSSQFSTTDEDTAGREASAAGKEPREKKVKGPGVQGREKRVKGPSARRRGRSS